MKKSKKICYKKLINFFVSFLIHLGMLYILICTMNWFLGIVTMLCLTYYEMKNRILLL